MTPRTVVLPAPFGPRRAVTLATSDADVDAVDHLDAAVGGPDPAQRDRRDLGRLQHARQQMNPRSGVIRFHLPLTTCMST